MFQNMPLLSLTYLTLITVAFVLEYLPKTPETYSEHLETSNYDRAFYKIFNGWKLYHNTVSYGYHIVNDIFAILVIYSLLKINQSKLIEINTTIWLNLFAGPK